MRILSLDFGERRIGVALSDALKMTAQPLSVVERSRLSEDLDAIVQLIASHNVESVVIGLPLTLKGERGPQAQRAMAFGDALKQRISIPVEWVDERFTTAQASRALRQAGQDGRKQKASVDQAAAQLILQAYLDAKSGGGH